MQDLQHVFNRIRETKAEQKELRKMYKDSLNNSREYADVVEKLDALKERKKAIETEIKEDNTSNFKKLDALRMHVKTDNEMLSDLALNKLMAGETVEIVDGENQRFEPVFTVRFKKA